MYLRNKGGVSNLQCDRVNDMLHTEKVFARCWRPQPCKECRRHGVEEESSLRTFLIPELGQLTWASKHDLCQFT